MEESETCAYTISGPHEVEDVSVLATHALFKGHRLVVTAKSGDVRGLIFKAWQIRDEYRVLEYTGQANGLYPSPASAVSAGLSAARDFFNFK